MTIGKVAVLLFVLLVLTNMWWFAFWLLNNNYGLFAPTIVISCIGTLILVCVLLENFFTYLKKHW